jgi:hypothetical protein
MALIGPTCGFLVSSDDGAEPTSLDGIIGETEIILYQTEDVRTAEEWISKSEQDSGDNDIPLTSDSLLVTFGVVDFFPMTVLCSQSTLAPFMSITGIVCAESGCSRGDTLSMSVN